MIIHLFLLGCLFASPQLDSVDQASVRIEPPQLQGSRPLEKQTEAAVVREYLQAWKTFQTAFDTNQPLLLDANFVGTAHDRLAETIEAQTKAGIHTRYRDRSHDLQIVFYSPEGLSIQILDTVEYEEEVLDHDKVLTTKQVRQKYVVVLSPSEVRWRVRIFQAGAM